MLIKKNNMTATRVEKIDRTNFYINDLKYTANSGDLWVSGFDPAFFKGAANVISEFEYEGRTMKVTRIVGEAFKNCTVLTSLTIPECITKIEKNAFAGCANLETITINSNVVMTESREMFDFMVSTFGKQIKKYIIGNAVTRIPDYAFNKCEQLKSVDISEGVTSIGRCAFQGCHDLLNIIIPNTVKYIGENAFDNTAWYENQADGLIYAGKVAYKYKGIMPAETRMIIKEDTTQIGNGAFKDCNGLKEIIIPNSIKIIDDFAFAGCCNMSRIQIPDNVDSIGDGVFFGCERLEEIALPSKVKHMSVSFNGCKNLKSISLPQGLCEIDDFAFNDCVCLENLIVPNLVKRIGNCAFYGCSKLRSIALPDTLASIGISAFSGCCELEDINLPMSVTEIGGEAFKNCSKLRVITLPECLTNFAWCVFDGCYNLKIILCKAKTPPYVAEIDYGVEYGTFDLDSSIKYLATLVVPEESLGSYKTANYWQEFIDIEGVPL